MLKSSRTGKTVAAAILVALCSVAAGSTMAETKWDKTHPRRNQVNDRLARQNKRIKHERKEGDITKAQAHALHRDDRQIRQEERDMASQNRGHITRVEQKTLNQQENALGKEIGK